MNYKALTNYTQTDLNYLTLKIQNQNNSNNQPWRTP